MIFLTVAIAALLVGPAIYGFARRREAMIGLLDGFIFVTISGLVLIVILPESFENGGALTLLFALIGLFGPTLLESLSRQFATKTHVLALVLGLSGLLLHALIDGAALSHLDPTPGSSSQAILPLAIILHRLPVGLTIWWLLRPSFGTRIAAMVLGMMALVTVAGFALAPLFLDQSSSQVLAWFQALVAGTLLHVVFHQPHLADEEGCGCKDTAAENNRYEGVGALLGIVLVVLLLAGGTLHHHGEPFGSSLQVFWRLSLESAPALLLAYLMAGALHAFLPHSSMRWLRSGSSTTQAVRGMAIGLPFPICSCGVVPVYRSLIRRGAPATAGMAFLIATPELGLDAVILSIPLLGSEMTILRIVCAALVAVLVGILVGRLCKSSDQAEEPETESAASPQISFQQKAKKALHVGLGEVVDHTAPWIVLGLAIAAVAYPFLDSQWLTSIPSSLQVPLFTLIGLPAYVCASGATPLVAILLVGGVSPGAAIAFLLTGPATNITTFGILGQLHSRRIALIFSVVIICLSMGLGYLVNWFFPLSGQGAIDPSQTEEASLLQLISLVLLTLVYLGSLLRRGARRFVGELMFRSESALDLHPHYH